MGWRIKAFLIDDEFSVESLFLPATLSQCAIKGIGNLGLSAAADGEPAFFQPEIVQYITDVTPFIRKVLLQDGARMLPFMDFIMLTNELWQ